MLPKTVSQSQGKAIKGEMKNGLGIYMPWLPRVPYRFISQDQIFKGSGKKTYVQSLGERVSCQNPHENKVREKGYFKGRNFCGDKLSWTPRGKIAFRWNIRKQRKFGQNFLIFMPFLVFFWRFLIDISRITSKVPFRRYKLSWSPKKNLRNR